MTRRRDDDRWMMVVPPFKSGFIKSLSPKEVIILGDDGREYTTSPRKVVNIADARKDIFAEHRPTSI